MPDSHQLIPLPTCDCPLCRPKSITEPQPFGLTQDSFPPACHTCGLAHNPVCDRATAVPPGIEFWFCVDCPAPTGCQHTRACKPAPSYAEDLAEDMGAINAVETSAGLAICNDCCDSDRCRAAGACQLDPVGAHAHRARDFERQKAIHEAKLPQDPQARKNAPICRGVLDYFPAALAAVADCSRIATEQHHPGHPMHWERGKSTDHADCLVRHLIERGTIDTDGVRHATKVAWRALALLQTELEDAAAAVTEK